MSASKGTSGDRMQKARGDGTGSRSIAKSVSIVIPTIGSEARLRLSLPSAVKEVEARSIAADEILIVDDSGLDRASGTVPEVLGAEDGDRRAKVRILSTGDNLGFSAAVRKGMQEARNSLVLVLHDDVALMPGALDELTKAFLQPGSVAPTPEAVFAASPRITHAGAGPEVPPETTGTLTLVDDRLTIFEGQPAVEPESGESADAPRLASFLPSSAFMMLRQEFLDSGGFDSLFAPFSWEDVDFSLSARRRGRLLIEVPKAKAIHGLGDAPAADASFQTTDAELASRVIERNRLLLRWKHLTTRADATEHLVSLWRTVLEAGLAGDRETLEHVCLAFEKLGAVTASRAKVAGTPAVSMRG
ncbi:Glycosyl transferase family 2 [Planctomycetes bacterium Poly30]|uniref:Glycosyl transferase family 2 n=1 Tax=Saltatorellus ferox TaxID=2528018 RepID=A0A518EWL3_9BACT|nr:Glycosyl transferase family 2 [Planctomycetes bacterium Poly30]